jgi:membrane-bound inhibitor of C-type lysozyme
MAISGILAIFDNETAKLQRMKTPLGDDAPSACAGTALFLNLVVKSCRMFAVVALATWCIILPKAVAAEVHGPLSFLCENGTKFSITFYNDTNNYTASIKVNGGAVETLKIVQAGSGAHYAGARYSYDEWHGESTLGDSLHGAKGISCHEDRNRKWEAANCRPGKPSDEVAQDARCYAYFNEVRAKQNEYGQKQEMPVRNAPHPSFQGELSLFGLHGGQSKSDVLKVLGKSNEAVCHFDQSDYTTKCTFTKGSFGWSVDFYENRLGSYRVTFPANDWNQQVASIKAALHAEPTDIDRNTSELLMTWKSTATVPCAADAAKECPAEIILLNTNSKESESTLNYMYLPVENKVVVDGARRAMSKFR